MSREHYETRASRRPKQIFSEGWLDAQGQRAELTIEQASEILAEETMEDMVIMAALHGVYPAPRGWRKV